MNVLQVPFQKLRVAVRRAGMQALMAGAADRHQLEEELITHMGIGLVVDFPGRSLQASFANAAGSPENALAHGLPVSGCQIATIDSPPLRLPPGDGRFPALPVGINALAETPLVHLFIPLRAPLAVGDTGVWELIAELLAAVSTLDAIERLAVRLKRHTRLPPQMIAMPLPGHLRADLTTVDVQRGKVPLAAHRTLLGDRTQESVWGCFHKDLAAGLKPVFDAQDERHFCLPNAVRRQATRRSFR
jgi:hypothetical protein